MPRLQQIIHELSYVHESRERTVPSRIVGTLGKDVHRWAGGLILPCLHRGSKSQRKTSLKIICVRLVQYVMSRIRREAGAEPAV